MTSIATHPPAIVIRLELESRPKLLLDCLNEGEEQRLRDWLNANPELAELVLRSLALLREHPAAA